MAPPYSEGDCQVRGSTLPVYVCRFSSTHRFGLGSLSALSRSWGRWSLFFLYLCQCHSAPEYHAQCCAREFFCKFLLLHRNQSRETKWRGRTTNRGVLIIHDFLRTLNQSHKKACGGTPGSPRSPALVRAEGGPGRQRRSPQGAEVHLACCQACGCSACPPTARTARTSAVALVPAAPLWLTSIRAIVGFTKRDPRIDINVHTVAA